jgi:uncharacterized LabA/DUF88 family protein
MAQVIVYVDGFNLYYGAVKDTAYKWLDLVAVCRRLLPSDDITRIKYFTARVTARREDPKAPQRQDTYLRALRTIPNLEIHYGQFREWPERKRLAHPRPGGPTTAEVLIPEEKGSDVNLATLLMLDGLTGRCEVSVVMSNDSDLTLPVRLLRDRGHPVGVINPHPPEKASRDMRAASSFYKQLRPSILADCQFPDTLEDENGAFRSPWGTP